jgi:hypothetical protein
MSQSEVLREAEVRRARARQAKRWAASLTNGADRETLQRYAEQLEREAEALEAEAQQQSR